MTGALRVTLSCVVAMSLTGGSAGCGGGDDARSDIDPSPAATAPDDRGGEQQVSSPSSGLTARDAADRFAVLRDESRLAEPSSRCSGVPGSDGPGSQSYLMRRQHGLYFCATVGPQAICVWTFRNNGGGHGGCFPARNGWSQKLERFAEGSFGVATISARDGDLIYATVPDGTRDARLTYRDGTIESLPIEDNFLGVVADRQPATVSWTKPDGKRFTTEP